MPICSVVGTVGETTPNQSGYVRRNVRRDHPRNVRRDHPRYVRRDHPRYVRRNHPRYVRRDDPRYVRNESCIRLRFSRTTSYVYGTGRMIDHRESCERIAERIAGRLAGRLAGRFAGRLAGRLAERIAGCFSGWLAGCFAPCVGWLLHAKRRSRALAELQDSTTLKIGKGPVIRLSDYRIYFFRKNPSTFFEKPYEAVPTLSPTY